ncbi:hypothetical protein FA15DRAFT_43794 [Coprinopsis marcescibilis]|uniref:EGF-like domain-containing protein n=1 Tax=Coprinopsis marcescibilis TaxID=230819 RepID=A0A5C3L7S7_COPMA|nr:hypothetical protein FA15DRAFT_43794 [Coprinopsis marcescibilis]
MFESISLLLFTLVTLVTLSYSQAPLNPEGLVLCFPDQCIQGYSNISIGARFITPDGALPLFLLPGQYSDQTGPQWLNQVITNRAISVSPSAGFSDSTTLPLNLQLRPGIAIYTDERYSGRPAFSDLPPAPVVNVSVALPAKSLAVPNDMVAIIASSSNTRVVVWEAIPDVSQLPSNVVGPLSLTGLESVACSPSCASSGLCTASGTCQCTPGFTGDSCERCSPGFFGPECKQCPSDCDECDDGITGTGACLRQSIVNLPSTCNCENGVCGANGQCSCTTGFQTGDDGRSCSKCSDGFFRTGSGDCKRCSPGCDRCEDNTGACTTCRPGFSASIDANSPNSCDPPTPARPDGIPCGLNSFFDGNECRLCDSACGQCSGPTSNDCTVCNGNLFMQNGRCVSANSDGVCSGSNEFADNNSRQCESCGAKCMRCRFDQFEASSVPQDVKCTECIAGFFVHNGQCVETCPTGTLAASGNCVACDSSCASCAGAADFCLTCNNNQFASSGSCVSSCPSGTFQSSSGSCLTCNADCASCSGGEFNQCTACPSNRPVLLDGRCLPRCAKNQFYDQTSSRCLTCDTSCSSCSGAGPDNCLACSGAQQVLSRGTCVDAACEAGTSVVPGLGVCLSDLVVQGPPLPTIPGIDVPVTKRVRLEWWQILLIALGCAFILILILWLVRRRHKEKKQQKFVLQEMGQTTNRSGWRWKLVRWGEKLFGQRRNTQLPNSPTAHKPLMMQADPYATYKMNATRVAEEGSSRRSTSNLLGGGHSRTGSSSNSTPGQRSISLPMQSVSLYDDNITIQQIGMYDEGRRAPKPPSSELRASQRLASSTSTSNESSSRSSRSQTSTLQPPPRPPRPAKSLDDDDGLDDASVYSVRTSYSPRTARGPYQPSPLKQSQTESHPPTSFPQPPPEPQEHELTSKFSANTLTPLDWPSQSKKKRFRYDPFRRG